MIEIFGSREHLAGPLAPEHDPLSSQPSYRKHWTNRGCAITIATKNFKPERAAVRAASEMTANLRTRSPGRRNAFEYGRGNIRPETEGLIWPKSGGDSAKRSSLCAPPELSRYDVARTQKRGKCTTMTGVGGGAGSPCEPVSGPSRFPALREFCREKRELTLLTTRSSPAR